LENTKEMFARAYAGRYAIGAFNVCNMETTQAVAQAAAKLCSPVIFQISQGAAEYAGIKFLKAIVETAVEKHEIRAAMHLDHSGTFELCKECIDLGFTSVMIDGSNLPFEENVALTKKVADCAHEHGISAEGELGRLLSAKECVDSEHLYTKPEQTEEFVRRTGIDSLAVSVGTSHGVCKHRGTTSLRFDILEEISLLLPGFPLVLHGASSVSVEKIKEISKYNTKISDANGMPEGVIAMVAKTAVCKINMDTDLRLAATLAVKKHLSENASNLDPRGYFGALRSVVRDTVEHKISFVLGSANSAT
jgi:fructose-bisphosphate aldolase class II